MSSIKPRYRIEFWVRCSLRSYESKPFRFTARDADVKLRLPGDEDHNGKFIAAVELTHSMLEEAELHAHDLLTQVLNIIALEYKMPALVESRWRSQVEESGEIRHCAIYSTNSRPRRLYLMKPQADEIQRLLEFETPPEEAVAMYWLRWSYLAERSPEAFFFAWTALERLVGDEDRQATCSKCGKPVVCPEHGAHIYRNVSRSKTKELLLRYGVERSAVLLKLRHSLVHGGLRFTVEKRAMMNHAVPLLWKVVEGELNRRLKTRTVVHRPGGGRALTSIEPINCEYRTSCPAEPFPPDCPTDNDVQDYKDLIPKGRTHSKIVNLLEWPPTW